MPPNQPRDPLAWRLYVYLRKLHLIRRDRKFEHRMWDTPESLACDASRRKARRSLRHLDLRDKEVHHRDGNCLNNAPENLQVVTKCEHARLHGRECRRSQS